MLGMWEQWLYKPPSLREVGESTFGIAEVGEVGGSFFARRLTAAISSVSLSADSSLRREPFSLPTYSSSWGRFTFMVMVVPTPTVD